MINRHPTEEEIQLFVTGQSDNRSPITDHIKVCDICRDEVLLYQLLVDDLAKQTSASFDFNIEALISSRLQPVKVKYKKDGFLIGIAISLSTCLVLTSLYIFRSNFLMLADATSVLFLCTSLISFVFILALKAIQLYRKYQEQIKTVNFS